MESRSMTVLKNKNMLDVINFHVFNFSPNLVSLSLLKIKNRIHLYLIVIIDVLVVF